MCFTCILVCVFVFVHGCLFCICICMYVCMHACLCSYGVYKNLHLTHLLYTAVSFYFFMSFCFFLVFILSSVCFFRSLFIVSLLLLLVLLLLFLHQETWRKSLSWVLLFPDYSLLLSFCVCVYVCKLEHVVTNLSVSQLVCMSVEKPFKACYCCFIFFLCCFFSHASVSILAFGWYQMREYFCCCCCFYEFVIYK